MAVSVVRKRSFWLLLGLGFVLALSWRHMELLTNPEALFNALSALGRWTVPVFLTSHVLATAVGIPGTLLVIVGGAKFGLWWGSLWSLLGATLGAIAAFWVARYLLQGWFRRRFSRHKMLQKLDKVMDTHAFNCVLAVRFAPLSPFNLVNFVFGLTSVPVGAYAIGTLVGIAPGTMAYTWLGVAGREALQGENFWHLGAALGCLALLSLTPLWFRKRPADSA